jgi:hypothetical protein
MSETALATRTVLPFRSLSELRGEHAKLMRGARGQGPDGDLHEQVGNFLERAQATGAVLDEPNDRDSAQGVLDYWTAWLFSAPDAAALSATPAVLAAFDPKNATPLATTDEPYMGLRAFSENDSDRFLGREDAIGTMLEKLRRHSVVFVVGPLGSGKTSLVLAGVVPRLKSRIVMETQKEPICPIVLPGNDPFGALLKAIQQAATTPLPGTWIDDNRKRLERSPETFAELVRTAVPESPVIIILDQFEELFTLSPGPTVREKFTQAIVSLAPDPQGSNRAILIIRDDFAAATFNLDALKSLADDSACFSPPAPTGTDLIRIIKSGADKVGLKFDEGIVEDLANQVSGDVASLPTLQFTLSKLWAKRRGNRITTEAYSEVGRPREALRRAAEAVYATLDPDTQDLAQKIFLELVQPGIGEEVQRRRARRDVLRELAPEAPERVALVLDRFVEAGLIRKTMGLDADDERFEVAHEALVRDWPRLNAWVRVKRQESEKKLQLITTAKLWQKSGNPGYLLQGDAIKEAAAFRDAAPQLRDLIAASEQAAQRRARWKYYGGTAIGIVFGAFLALSVTLWWKKSTVSTDYDRYERSTQDLEVKLEEANKTIANQKQHIADLELRLQARAIGAPPPPLRQPVPPITDARQQGYVWVGTEAQSNVAEPGGKTAISPGSVKANARYEMLKNVVLRGDKPSETYAQGPSLGVIPEGTVLTATGPAIPYVRPSGTTQYWLPVKVDPSDQPIVYVQFAGGDRARAQQFADNLRTHGYRIPAVQPSSDARGLNEVRYYYPQDKATAEKVASDVTQVLRQRGYNLPPTKVVDSTGSAGHPGALELWLDLPTSR